ncbi:predicted protein [Uncinocarpus reesii 1704]|uniref:Uncharacterized protein n=1 Tax=Uncinocarpus reesii (strain UAMH 1704) TaxID=336963 RepID=C4JKQ9_UNCRE|nr:uncharacterized protein UREG_00657 [Uncinocarpus reesii 1704]EEP75810.1 predicted protein [Uncinocarpus reesii 1704]
MATVGCRYLEHLGRKQLVHHPQTTEPTRFVEVHRGRMWADGSVKLPRPSIPLHPYEMIPIELLICETKPSISPNGLVRQHCFIVPRGLICSHFEAREIQHPPSKRDPVVKKTIMRGLAPAASGKPQPRPAVTVTDTMRNLPLRHHRSQQRGNQPATSVSAQRSRADHKKERAIPKPANQSAPGSPLQRKSPLIQVVFFFEAAQRSD